MFEATESFVEEEDLILLSDEEILKNNDKDYDWDNFNNMAVSQLKDFLVGHNGFIAGGVFKDIYLNKSSKDIDIFFRCEDDFNNAVEFFDKSKKFNRLYSSSNSIGFTSSSSFGGEVIDLVQHIFGSPQDILESFDFKISQCALVKDDEIESHSVVGEKIDSSVFDCIKIDDDKNSETYSLIRNKSFNSNLNESILEVYEGCSVSQISVERLSRYLNYGFIPKDDNLSLQVLSNLCSVNKEIEDADLNLVIERYQKTLYFNNENKDNGNIKSKYNSFNAFIKDIDNVYSDYISKANDSSFFNYNVSSSFSSHYSFIRKTVRSVLYFSENLTKNNVRESFGSIQESLQNYFSVKNKDYASVVSRTYFSKFSFLTAKVLNVIDKYKLSFSEDEIFKLISSFLYTGFVSYKNSKENRYNVCSFFKMSVNEFIDMEFDGGRFNDFNGYPSNDDSCEVFLRILRMNDNEDWEKMCIQFFVNMNDERINEFPSLREWHEFLNGESFDLNASPVLSVALILDDDLMELH